MPDNFCDPFDELLETDIFNDRLFVWMLQTFINDHSKI